MMNRFSDETRRNPQPTYEQLRSRSPVLHEPHSDSWLVFDYEGVKRTLTDHEAFSSIVAPPEAMTHPVPFPENLFQGGGRAGVGWGSGTGTRRG
jgi:cytochrome P450